MSDDLIALEREFLACQAWYEVGALLKMFPKVDFEQPESLRGLANRCDKLIDVMHEAMEFDRPADVEDMRLTVYGFNHRDARDEFSSWLENKREQEAKTAD